MAFFEGSAKADVPDNVSLAATDTSTSASLFTRYTNRSTGTLNTQTTRKTSKNRRREERKRARGKKGSVYEEEYLINSIRRLIERINSIRDEVDRLIVGLMRRRMRERAMAVEKAAMEVVELCASCLDEVFGGHQESNPVDPTPEVSRAGPEGVLMETMEQMGKKQEPPVVLPFRQSQLLSS